MRKRHLLRARAQAGLRALFEKSPPEERDKLLASLDLSSQPFDVDSTIAIEPIFDAPIDERELG